MKKPAILTSVLLSASAVLMCGCGHTDEAADVSEVTEDGIIYDVYSDHAEIKGCSENIIGDIVIPQNVGGVDVTVIDDYAFNRCKELRSIALPETIETIGVCAFEKCSALDVIQIEEGVTSIGAMAFNGCESLMTVKIPESCKSIDKLAFHDCNSLRNVTFLNPVCNIFDQANTICNTYSEDAAEAVYIGTIYGEDNSTAQKFAKKYEYAFKSSEKHQERSPYDANGDGMTDASDASLVLSAYSKLATGVDTGMTDEELKACDADGDGLVDSSDASEILSMYSKLSTGG